MIKKGHPIDEYFSSELKNIEITPPEGVWNSIENKLNKKHKAGIIWYRLGWAAGIALFVAISGTLYLQFNKSERSESQNQVASHKSPTIVLKNQQNNTVVSDIQPKSDNPVTLNSDASSKKQFVSDIPVEIHKKKIESNINKTVISSEKTDRLTNFSPLSPHLIAFETKLNTDIVYQSIKGLQPLDSSLLHNTIREKTLAQEPLRIKKHKWSLEGEFAPTYAFRVITNTYGSSPSSSKYNSNESGLFAWSGGLKANYSANRRLSFQAGVFYSIMGQVLNNIYVSSTNIGKDEIRNNYPMNTNYIENSLGPASNVAINTEIQNNVDYLSNSNYYTNIGPAESIISDNKMYGSPPVKKIDAKIVQKLHYIEIPLIARYRIVDRRFKFHVLSGINTNILLRTNTILKSSGSKEELGRTTNIKPVNYSAIAGLGFSVPLQNKINFLFEPTFKYNINSVSNNTLRDVHLYSINLYTGFSINL